jgi:hypothetical protein
MDITSAGPAAGSQSQNDDTASGSPSPGGALSPWAPRGVFRNSLTSDSSSAGMPSSSECCPRMDVVNRHNAIVKREMQYGHCNYKKAGQDIMKQLADFQFKSPFLLGDDEPSVSTDREERTHGSHFLAYRHHNTCLIQDYLGVLNTKYYVTRWHDFVTPKLNFLEALSRSNSKQSFYTLQAGKTCLHL